MGMRGVALEVAGEVAAEVSAELGSGALGGAEWATAVAASRPDGQHCQSWLWSAPAKHSTRQITEVLERIAFLTDLGIDQHMGNLNDVLVRRYLESVVYQAVSENMASEQSARMVAMKAATDNAGNVISELKLVYNKTRQAAITTELSEIVAGAAAV